MRRDPGRGWDERIIGTNLYCKKKDQRRMEVRGYLHVDLWPLMAILQTEIKQASYIINSNVRAFRIIKEIMRNVSRLLY